MQVAAPYSNPFKKILVVSMDQEEEIGKALKRFLLFNLREYFSIKPPPYFKFLRYDNNGGTRSGKHAAEESYQLVFVEVSLDDQYTLPMDKWVQEFREVEAEKLLNQKAQETQQAQPARLILLCTDNLSWLCHFSDSQDPKASRMLGILRCNIGHSGIIEMIKAQAESLKKRIKNALKASNTFAECLLNKRNCFSMCGKHFDPRTPEEIKYENWAYLFLDDEILEFGDPPPAGNENSLPPEQFWKKLVDSQTSLRGVAENILTDTKFKGCVWFRGTETACRIMRGGKTCDVVRLLRHPIYPIETFDFLFVDVIFDRKVALDIRLIPRLQQLCRTPIYVLSGAGVTGTHGESALYYATRALRYGARGYFDKTDQDLERLVYETIIRGLEFLEWKREWEERFGDAYFDYQFCPKSEGNEPLHKWLERQGGYDPDAPEKFKYILCKLFEDCEKIRFARAPDEGVGPSWKFYVSPVSKGRGLNRKLVKLGEFEEMQFEPQNYSDYINGYLDTFVGQIRGPGVRAGKYFGLVYSCVGYASSNGDRRLESEHKVTVTEGDKIPLDNFQDVLYGLFKEADGWRQAEKLLNDLARRILDPLYRDHSVVDNRKIKIYETFQNGGVSDISDWWKKEYAQVLPPILEFRTEKDPSPPQPGDYLRYVEQRTLDDDVWSRIDGDFQSVASDSADILGFVLSYKKEKQKNGKYRFKLTVLNPQVHRIVAINIMSKGDIEEKLYLRYGKLLRFENCERTASVLETLRSQANEAFEARVSPNPLHPLYRPLLQEGIPAESLFTPSEACFDILRGFLKEPPSVPMVLGTVHGDLNLGNIMVSQPGKGHYDYWLIDFEKTHRWGHVAFDFAKMEVEIKTHLLSKILLDLGMQKLHQCRDTAGASQRILRSLVSEFHFLEAQLMREEVPVGIEPSIHNVYQTLRHIRGLSRNYGIEPDELYLSLFLYSMAALKFSKLSNPTKMPTAPFPKVLLCISANVQAPYAGEYMSRKALETPSS